METNINKIANEIISSLKKMPSPANKKDSFWDFMKSQLADEGTWDQNHLKVIEKEIGNHLAKIDKKTLNEMWLGIAAGIEKIDSDTKVDVKEMKADLTDELFGMVMDRMDDNYSSRDNNYFSESNVVEKSAKEDDEDFVDDAEPEKIEDEDLNLEDDELFDDELDDEEANF